jgi:hypothetical protein
MADVRVYRFVPHPTARLPALPSLGPATLDAISAIGHPIMESEFVVDSSELDARGFLASPVAFGSSEITALTTKIRSLELRAASRDRCAQSMRSDCDEEQVQMLNRESRCLRAQERELTIRRAKLLADEAGHISTTMAFS